MKILENLSMMAGKTYSLCSNSLPGAIPTVQKPYKVIMPVNSENKTLIR